jgi:hypothetical protein
MKFQGSVIMNNGILFLDIDGVLNSHTYYEELVEIYSISGFQCLSIYFIIFDKLDNLTNMKLNEY